MKQIRKNEELLKYLSEKIANAFKINKPKFYIVDTSPILQEIHKDFKELPQSEQERLKAKLNQDLSC